MKNNKYLKIDAKSILKKYDEEKEDNKIIFDIFEKYQIPSCYQAIILKKNKNRIYEITTNNEFFPDAIKKTENGKNLIFGNFKNDILTFIKGTYEEYGNKDLIKFLKGIKEADLSQEYFKAVKEIMTNKLVLSKKPLTLKKNPPKGIK